MICIYAFKAFPLPTDISASVDFVCFQDGLEHKRWIQRPLPLDALPFSEVRQEKIVKILPWKYLAEYDYAIYVSSEQDISKAMLLLKNIEKNPYKDAYLLLEDSIDVELHSQLNRSNLNIKSQLQKYKSASEYDPKFFYNTDCIAFNVHSKDFKEFSINWMNETLKESLNDEISFSWLLSFSTLNLCECRYEISDADCFFKIVVPNYNNGSELEKCLQSILSQSFKSFKIVVVDDCSTDESADIAKQYAEKYPEQVFFLSTGTRSYSGKARNLGASFNPFTSKYTWFVDGDDLLYKDSVLKDLFEKACLTNADIVSFDCAYVKDNKVDIKKFSVPDFNDPEKVLTQFGIAPWHRIVKTDKVVPFFENCIRRQDLATVFRQYANCDSSSHLSRVCYIYNSRDYGALKEPIWSLQSVWLEMMRQSRDLSECYANAILHYLSKYPKVFGSLSEEKLNKQNVVAMASYPLRKAGMVKVFKQLLPQCDHFCLYLNGYDEIPEELLEAISDKDRLKVTIEIGGKNLKDYGKFFWWKRFPGYYLTVDDDLEYPEDYVKTLVSRMDDFKDNAVLGLHGNDFTVIDGAFVVRKHCHAFLSKEEHDVPIDCLGTGASCYYPANFSFTLADILKNYHEDNDLDMSMSILVKSEGKMLYRISSRKDFVGMNADGVNYVNPLADIHFAWEKRYLQYDFWLNRETTRTKCAFCCIQSSKIDFEMLRLLSEVKNDANNEGFDFYCVPIEEKALTSDSIQLYFVKFELVKKFLKRYGSVSIWPLTEKDLRFDFTKENSDEILSKVEKIKAKKLKRISDKILKANLLRM